MTQHTLASARALARRRLHPHAQIRVNKTVPDREGREEALLRIRTIRLRCADIENELSATRDAVTRLAAAARFVADVNGDPPSIDQLREAVEAVEVREALRDELTRLRVSIKEQHTYRRRYECVYRAGLGNCVLGGDTLEELVQRIEGERLASGRE
jgi:hypothetical protein